MQQEIDAEVKNLSVLSRSGIETLGKGQFDCNMVTVSSNTQTYTHSGTNTHKHTRVHKQAA